MREKIEVDIRVNRPLQRMGGAALLGPPAGVMPSVRPVIFFFG